MNEQTRIRFMENLMWSCVKMWTCPLETCSIVALKTSRRSQEQPRRTRALLSHHLVPLQPYSILKTTDSAHNSPRLHCDRCLRSKAPSPISFNCKISFGRRVVLLAEAVIGKPRRGLVLMCATRAFVSESSTNVVIDFKGAETKSWCPTSKKSIASRDCTSPLQAESHWTGTGPTVTVFVLAIC